MYMQVFFFSFRVTCSAISFLFYVSGQSSAGGYTVYVGLDMESGSHPTLPHTETKLYMYMYIYMNMETTTNN